jgi:hypothetical protein
VIEMAQETRRTLDAERLEGRVFVVPVVWKLHFTGDVSRALENEIAHVERRLGPGLARSRRAKDAPLERRFADLQKAVLARSLAREDAAAAPAADDIADGAFFALQAEHADRLLDDLEARHGRTEGDFRRRSHALRRAILESRAAAPDALRRDRRRLLEIERLHQFTVRDYGGATLTQEQIAESVKALRLAVLRGGVREALHAILPVAVAPRVVRVRVPEPIAIDFPDAPIAETLAMLHARMQGGLDALNAEIAPAVDPWRRPNPFAAAPAAD